MPIHANVSAVSLRTGIEAGPSFNFVDNRMIDVAADGALWATDGRRVMLWSNSERALMPVGAIAVPARRIRAVAAVTGFLAYFLHTDSGKATVVSFTPEGIGTALPPLPAEEAPVSVTASSDGTVWVSGTTGKIFAKDATGWRAVPMPPGGAPELLSVGSEKWAVAVTPNPTHRTFYTFDGSTWKEILRLPLGVPFWAEACEDGAYWLALGTSLQLVLPSGTNVSFTLPEISMSFGRFAAGSRYACHFADVIGMRSAVYGLLEEAASGWEKMTPAEAKAYGAINRKLQISDPAGVRGQYKNTVASVSAWYTDVSSMAQPADVAEADWVRVRDAVMTELKAVESVHKLFVNLKLLNNAVGLRLSEARQRVTALVGLPEEEHAQPKTPIDLALEGLLDKAFDAALKKVPASMSKAVNVAVALAKDAADKEARALGAPDAGTTMQIACADLISTMAAVQKFTGEAAENAISAILTDQRKLLAAGCAVTSGAWYWPPAFDMKTIADAGTAAELQMLQMLMPVRWSILRFQTFFTSGDIIPSPRPWPTHAPALALMFKKVLDQRANMICWWWICAADGAPPRRETTGPFPNAALIEAIMKLSMPLDFFTGSGGWKLPVRIQDGYTPPPDGVPWEPWVNRDSPLQ